MKRMIGRCFLLLALVAIVVGPWAGRGKGSDYAGQPNTNP